MSLVPAGCPTRAELHDLIQRVQDVASKVEEHELSHLLREVGHAAVNLIGGLADIHDAQPPGYDAEPILDPAGWHTVWTDSTFSVSTDHGLCTVRTGQQCFKHNATGAMVGTTRYRLSCGDDPFVASTESKLLRAELERYMQQFGPALLLRAQGSLGRMFL